MPKKIFTMNVLSNYDKTEIIPVTQNDHQLKQRIEKFEKIKKISQETHSVLYKYNRKNLSKFFTYDENICLFDYFVQKVFKVMAKHGLFETYLNTGQIPTIENEPYFIQKQGKKLEDEDPLEELKNDDKHELIESDQDLSDESVRIEADPAVDMTPTTINPISMMRFKEELAMLREELLYYKGKKLTTSTVLMNPKKRQKLIMKIGKDPLLDQVLLKKRMKLK